MKGTNPESQGHRWLKRSKKRQRTEANEEEEWEALEAKSAVHTAAPERAQQKKQQKGVLKRLGKLVGIEKANPTKGKTKKTNNAHAIAGGGSNNNPFSALTSLTPKPKPISISSNPFSALTSLAPKPNPEPTSLLPQPSKNGTKGKLAPSPQETKGARNAKRKKSLAV